MIHLLYDSDCELNLNIAKELGIESDYHHIKMPYIIQNKTYPCELITEELSNEFFDLVKSGNMPSTAALNPQEYLTKLEPFFANGDEMLYIAFSSNMSGTFNNLRIALAELTEKYPNAKFTRFDTLAISMSAGLFVVKAKQLLDEGKSVQEIVATLEEIKQKVQCYIVADDLMYLKRGGRLTALKALLGTMLQLKPIIKLTKEGTLIPTTNVAGRNKAIMTIMKEIMELATENEQMYLMADDKAEAERIIAKLQTLIPNVSIRHQFIGPVIGTHCGPGTLGFCFISKLERPDAIKD